MSNDAELKYFKSQGEWSALESGCTYYETLRGSAQREISIDGHRIVSSNVFDEEHRLCLAEGNVFEDLEPEIEEGIITPIDKSEFEQAWAKQLEARRVKWSAIKDQYVVDTMVTGSIYRFFPQGVIVDLGNRILAVTDHNDALESAGTKPLLTQDRISGRVAGYDEKFQWIILAEPVVHK